MDKTLFVNEVYAEQDRLSPTASIAIGVTKSDGIFLAAEIMYEGELVAQILEDGSIISLSEPKKLIAAFYTVIKMSNIFWTSIDDNDGSEWDAFRARLPTRLRLSKDKDN